MKRSRNHGGAGPRPRPVPETGHAVPLIPVLMSIMPEPSYLHSQQRHPVACAMQAPPSARRSKVMSCQSHPMATNGNQNSMGHMMEMTFPLTHVPASSHQSYPQPGHAHQQQSQERSPHSCAHHSPPAHPHLSQQPNPAQISPVPRITECVESPPQTSGGKRRRTAVENPDERRRKFLERNRAAASRCRQKRKVWVMSLEKKAEELTHTNLQLQVDPV
ncbi:Cyclic AMP-responsive element-binding protein 5 [Bagarius yarrelli]|uniref:Cyclic AMP-responsive element-binding protein 5 n=1 Tax=Bagarius yarrelli TaxID=175774 RepID=A0A556VV67_BAGYA|nr:Cyclic AMP-responsive element-binding protein 5 [Bagarius yarrelli]